MQDEVSETENIRKNLAIERMIVEGCDILLDVNQTFVRQGKFLLALCRMRCPSVLLPNSSVKIARRVKSSTTVRTVAGQDKLFFGHYGLHTFCTRKLLDDYPLHASIWQMILPSVQMTDTVFRDHRNSTASDHRQTEGRTRPPRLLQLNVQGVEERDGAPVFPLHQPPAADHSCLQRPPASCQSEYNLCRSRKTTLLKLIVDLWLNISKSGVAANKLMNWFELACSFLLS